MTKIYMRSGLPKKIEDKIEIHDYRLIKVMVLPGFCSDFRYEINGIFELGVGFFFFRQISTF